MSPLIHARHGTQAIVSGQGVYVAGGSAKQGGGNQRNMEVYNKDDPYGVTSVAGSFLDVQLTEILAGVMRAVTIEHVTGNQGVFVNSVELSGLSASDFRITNYVAGAFLVGKGEQRDILVEYSGSVDGAEAQLNVRVSNDNVLSIDLVGMITQPTVPPPPTPAPVTPTQAPKTPTVAPVTPMSESVVPTEAPTSEATQVVTSFLWTFPPVTERPSTITRRKKMMMMMRPRQ